LMIKEVSIREGDILRVTGPARIEVLSGSILAVGAAYGKGSSIVIHRFRSYGVKAIRNSKLRVTLGSDGVLEGPVERCEEVIDEWLSIVENIYKDSLDRGVLVAVLGPIESGKTTFTAFLANYFVQRGRRVAIVDADIGQEDVAIPTTIALTEPNKPFIWQRELRPTDIRFAGCISPQYCQTALLAAILDLIRVARERGYDGIVVNTDGWISSHQAIIYKINLIRWVRPTHVVILGRDIGEVLLRALPKGVRVYIAPRPLKVRERAREDRRRLRAEAYARYFANARVREVKLSDVKLINSVVLLGKRLEGRELEELANDPLLKTLLDNSLYVSLLNKVLNVVVKEGVGDLVMGRTQSYSINVVRPSDVKGLVVGVLDERMNDVAAGVVEGIDFSKGVIKVRTPWDGGIGALVLGDVKLLRNYEDSRRSAKCLV